MGNTHKPSCHVKESFSVTVCKTSADGSSKSETKTQSREATYSGGGKTLPPISLNAGYGKLSGGISAGGSSALAIKK